MKPIYSCFLDVRTYECDLNGHVNNATYLNYLEYARMKFLMDKGYTLEKLKKMGMMVVVVRIDCRYKSPAFPSDRLKLDIYLNKTGNSSGAFRQVIQNNSTGKIVVEAEVTWVFTNLSGKPVAIPDEIKTTLCVS